jgi:hypothetical protein
MAMDLRAARPRLAALGGSAAIPAAVRLADAPTDLPAPGSARGGDIHSFMIRRSCQCLGGWHLTIYRTTKRIDAEEKSAGGIIIPGVFVLACNIGGSDWKITLRFIRAIGYAATAFTSDALFGA